MCPPPNHRLDYVERNQPFTETNQTVKLCDVKILLFHA